MPRSDSSAGPPAREGSTPAGCLLCAQIPQVCDADLIADEGGLPEACELLVGWPSSLSAPLRRELSCPRCGARYSLEIETGVMEWDLRLVRAVP